MTSLLSILLVAASATPWSSLPPIASHRLAARFLESLRRHPTYRAGRMIYGDGDSLTFDFSLTNHDHGNGWGIQAQFLRLLLAAWFPRAEFSEDETEDRALVQLQIVDSRLASRIDDQPIEMDSLKTANPSFDLPPKAALRARMGLPGHAKIASFYAARSHPNDISAMYHALIGEGLANIVIVSTQGLDMTDAIRFEEPSAVSPAIFTSDEWVDGPPTECAVILNETRGRMPYVHAAADYAVVLGAANGVEALHQGRPTYVSRRLLTKRPQPRWDTYVHDLTAVRGAYAFETLPELMDLIRRTAEDPPAGPLYENGRILGRLLSQILTVIEQSVGPTL